MNWLSSHIGQKAILNEMVVIWPLLSITKPQRRPMVQTKSRTFDVTLGKRIPTEFLVLRDGVRRAATKFLYPALTI